MKHISNPLKILGLALVIGLGVSAVSAWNAPAPTTGTGITTSPTPDNAKAVTASINISIFDQIKKGGIIIPTADQKFVSPLSFFKKTLLPGNNTAVYIGGSGDATGTLNAAGWAIQFPGTRDVPLTINLKERDKITYAVKFKTDQVCPQTTKLINTKSSAFEFWNAKEGANADLIANGIRLEGGNPAPGKILIAVDDAGRAVWATPKLAANGTDITFEAYDDPATGVCQ
jgi:hypothetical protein